MSHVGITVTVCWCGIFKFNFNLNIYIFISYHLYILYLSLFYIISIDIPMHIFTVAYIISNVPLFLQYLIIYWQYIFRKKIRIQPVIPLNNYERHIYIIDYPSTLDKIRPKLREHSNFHWWWVQIFKKGVNVNISINTLLDTILLS